MQIAKLRPKRIDLNQLEHFKKYGDNVRRTVPCTVPIRSAAKSCLLARPRLPAGDRAGCWVPRQLSETRSATAVKAHNWLADSAVAVASKPQEVSPLAHPPLPESSCRVHLRGGGKCWVPRLQVNLVYIVYTSAVPATMAAPPRGGHVGPILQRAETSVCHQYAVTANAQRWAWY